MGSTKVNSFWDRDLSQPDHAAMLVRSSGDNYKSVNVQCWGSQHPYEVEEGDADDDCGWIGPNIPAGRWQEKHVREAYALHLAQVSEFGPIQHGRTDRVGGQLGNFPAVCRCSRCRLAQPATVSAPNPTSGVNRG